MAGEIEEHTLGKRGGMGETLVNPQKRDGRAQNNDGGGRWVDGWVGLAGVAGGVGVGWRGGEG